MLVAVTLERHDRPLSGLLAQALAVSLRQLPESAETAARRGHESVELSVLRIEQDDVVAELPRITRLALIELLPRCLVGVSEGVALRRDVAHLDGSHDVFARIAV